MVTMRNKITNRTTLGWFDIQREADLQAADSSFAVTLGALSPSSDADVLAMRRKLRAVAQRLGVSSSRATRLAAAASDHAKGVIRSTALEVLVGLSGSGAGQELRVEFAATHPGANASLNAGFDRVEPLIDAQRRGWRASCMIDPIAMGNPTISWCQAVIAEQNVEELVEALHVLVERYRHSRDRGVGHSRGPNGTGEGK
jgi:hypothetical protein